MAEFREADVVLLRPADGRKWETSPLLESMGVGFLTSALEREGVRVEVIDNYFEQLDERALLERVAAHRTPLVGVSISHQYPNMWPLFDFIRAFKCERPGTLISAGGHFPSFAPGTLLGQGGFDVVAIGEGESAIVPLFQAARNGTPLDHVKGLAFLRNGEMVRTGSAPVPDLESLARPQRPYLDRLYRQSPQLVRSAWHSVSRSRGCAAACSYCSVCAFARLGGAAVWRTRPPAAVIDELRWLNGLYGVRRVRFTDDEFAGFGAAGESAALDFAEAMYQSGLDMEFMISMRVEHATRRILDPLRRAGLEIVLLGIEAGNPQDLALYRKGTTLAKSGAAIETALAAGLQVVLALIPFHPWSTLERVRATLDWVRRQFRPGVILEPSVLLNRLGPLAGTAIEAMFLQEGLKADLYLDREAAPPYPFRDPQVARLYDACEHVLRPRAAAIESAVGEADLELERLRESLPSVSITIRRRLFQEVRYIIQNRFLEALKRIAGAQDPNTEAASIESALDNALRTCRRQFRLAQAGGPS